MSPRLGTLRSLETSYPAIDELLYSLHHDLAWEDDHPTGRCVETPRCSHSTSVVSVSAGRRYLVANPIQYLPLRRKRIPPLNGDLPTPVG
jgi:hypothetical protein